MIPDPMTFADALETLATALAVGLLAAILAAFTQVRR